MDSKRLGVLAVLFASFLWAVETIFAKLAYKDAGLIETLSVRAFFALLTAGAYLLVTGKFKPIAGKKQVAALSYILVVAVVFAEVLFYGALTFVPVVNATVISHLQPVFIALMAFLFFKEDKLAGRDYAGMALMIASGLLVTTRTLGNLAAFNFGTLGDLMILVATVLWATTAIAARKYLRGVDSGTMTFYRFLLAFAVFGTYMLFTSSLRISSVYPALMGIVVGIGYILYYEGLRRMKAAQVGAIELSTPFFAAILGFLVLRETVTALQILGLLLLFAGVYFLSKKEQ